MGRRRTDPCNQKDLDEDITYDDRGTLPTFVHSVTVKKTILTSYIDENSNRDTRPRPSVTVCQIRFRKLKEALTFVDPTE